MNILGEIDDNPLWELGDAYNSDIDSPIVPALPSADIDPDSIRPAELCDCGHYHSGDCPDPDSPCGDDYRCCH